MTHKRLSIGLLAGGFMVILAVIGIANGLWSKNLVVNGVVETGDLNVDWTFGTTPAGDDLCTDFNPLWVPDTDPNTAGNQPGCPDRVWKDVGKFDCYVDEDDNQILHVEIFNAYPSYEADCEYHFANTGSIPFIVIGAVVDPLGELSCGPDQASGPTIIVDCGELKIGYFDNIGQQIDPGSGDQTGSLKVHVNQIAEQSHCTADSQDVDLGPTFPEVQVFNIDCEEPTVSYEFDIKICVAQWNEEATYEDCVGSPQHEGPGGVGDPDFDGYYGDADNCPAVFNPDQTNADGDDYGAACDPDDTDPDNPGPP